MEPNKTLRSPQIHSTPSKKWSHWARSSSEKGRKLGFGSPKQKQKQKKKSEGQDETDRVEEEPEYLVRVHTMGSGGGSEFHGS